MNTAIIDLLFEYKSKIPGRTACVHLIAGLMNTEPDLGLVGGNGKLLAEVGDNYDEFEEHEKRMIAALDFFKSEDAYFAVHELAGLFSWKYSLEYTWRMAEFCKKDLSK